MRAAAEHNTNSIPLSETRKMELFAAERNYKSREVNNAEIAQLYKRLKDALKKARRNGDTEIYGRSKLNKIVKLSRQLSSLSALLVEFYKEYLHSPLSRNIDKFEKRLQEDIGEGASFEKKGTTYWKLTSRSGPS